MNVRNSLVLEFCLALIVSPVVPTSASVGAAAPSGPVEIAGRYLDAMESSDFDLKDGKVVESRGTVTFLLVKEKSEYRIRHLHWSSRRKQVPK